MGCMQGATFAMYDCLVMAAIIVSLYTRIMLFILHMQILLSTAKCINN